MLPIWCHARHGRDLPCACLVMRQAGLRQPATHVIRAAVGAGLPALVSPASQPRLYAAAFAFSPEEP